MYMAKELMSASMREPRLGRWIKPRNYRSAFKEMDINSDGRVDYAAFEAYCMSMR